jgi:N-methylhydantoinase A
MAQGPGEVRLAVDVGGTFTDFVAASVDGGFWWTAKLPSEPADPSGPVWRGLQEVQRQAPVHQLHHGTTLATNAMLEGRLARTALVATRGFTDTLELGRVTRDHLYSMRRLPKPPSPIPPEACLAITERVLADGSVRTPLADAELAPLAEALAGLGAEAVAVSLLHSYANPDHERRIGQFLRERLPYVSLSHEVNAEFREFERTSTTVANASLLPLIDRYLSALDARLAESGVRTLRIVHSSGGMMGLSLARARPLSLVLSGPAAGVAAARSLARTLGERNAVTLDMGGTSTDAALIVDGEAARISQRRLEGRVLRLPSLAVETVGAGGGSIASVNAAGALNVGPRSAGASPGPACYGLGGEAPTVTDAQLTLGWIPADRALGEGIRLDPTLATAALAPVAMALDLTQDELAWGICEIACAHMARAIRLITIEKGHDPRDFCLMAFGGGGPIHAGRVAQMLGISRIVVPPFASVFSAYGCLASEIRYEALQTFRARLGDTSRDDLAARLGDIEAGLRARLEADGVDPSTMQARWSLGLRYAGQNEEITLELPERWTLSDIHALFQARHEALYHYTPAEAVDVVTLHAAVTVPERGVSLPVAPDEAWLDRGGREVYFSGTGRIRVPVQHRNRVPDDHAAALGGPLLIEDSSTTIVVYPGQRAWRDAHGNIWIESEHAHD